MSLRCFVTAFVDFKALGGAQRYISAVIDQDFIIRDNKLIARGCATLRAGVGEDYTKDIILEISYSKDTKKPVVNVFWATEWLDCEGMPITQYARDGAAGVCSLDKAEGAAVRSFQYETLKMLAGCVYFCSDELKKALHIENYELDIIKLSLDK